MTYERDVQWLASLIRGEADSLAVDVTGRLSVLRAQYIGTGNAGMLDLIARGAEVHAAANRERDAAFLRSLIRGSADYFADDLYGCLALLHAKYESDPAMLALFNAAATTYGDVVVAAAQQALATLAAQELIDRAMGRREFE